MSSKIRWGIISTARINRALIEPIRQAKRSELVAVASTTLDKAERYAAQKGIPKAYGSYEALLADPQIDVIYNSLPNSLHCEWTVKAAQAGKHVLGEKGIINIPHPWKPGMNGDSQLIFTPHHGPEETIIIPAINPYLCQVQAMEACILDGAEPIVPLSLSREFLKSVLAIYQSATSGALVQELLQL